jgi:hypothetical protein
MFEFCEKFNKCSTVECNYTKGAICNYCEENCRTNDLPCILTEFEGFKSIEVKSDKYRELSQSGKSETSPIFYPTSGFDYTDV